MSVTYNIKKEGIIDNVMIPGSEVSGHILVKLIADKLKLRQNDILVSNPITGHKVSDLETIKDKYSVNVERLVKIGDQNSNLPGIVSNQQLQQMASKGRFFMIKSSNEENIQKARDHSVWATTFANQDRLRSAFLYTQHVFLLFATNRSLQIKGIARMESEPSKNPQKTFWSGVSNIRLGGNFQLKWLRKKPLTSLQIQKSVGSQIRDHIMRMSDGEEIDNQIAKKIVSLFELPTEPYYQIKPESIEMKEKEKKVLNIGEILGARDLPLGFSLPLFQPNIVSSIPSQVNPQKKAQKKKKIKKKDKKKKKEKKRKRSNSSSPSSSESSEQKKSSSSNRSSSNRSSSYSSSSSSSSRSLRKKKKIKKDKKDKKDKKERYSSKSQQKKSKKSRDRDRKKDKKKQKKRRRK